MGITWELVRRAESQAPPPSTKSESTLLLSPQGIHRHFRVLEHIDAGECGCYPLDKGKILKCFNAASNTIRPIFLKKHWKKGEGLTGGE